MHPYELPASVRAQIDANQRESERASAERTEAYKRQRAAEEKAAAEQARQDEIKRRAREEELMQMAQEREAEAKAKARREFPFSDEAFEAAWPTLRTELALDEVRRLRGRTAHPRDYRDGVGGGFSASSTFKSFDV
jgi:hypothetical protein